MLYGCAVVQVSRPDYLVKVSLWIGRVVTSLPAREELITTQMYVKQVKTIIREHSRKTIHTEMRMLRWARGKTKKDHVKNEDIWRETNIELTQPSPERNN